MTDRDFQIEIERLMRQHGSVGLFRCFGSAMEIFMGSLLAGDNAGTASPYDFALGGAGVPALPLGSNGTSLKEGMAVMVDMAGNYGVYYSDLTRTYSIGQLPEEAYRLHDLSLQLHREVMQQAKPGDVVILSPAAASFDQYRSYADRGEQFIAAVQGGGV